MPFVAQVAVGKRDYIHVTDLAQGHLSDLQWMAEQSDGESTGVRRAFNLGAGVGHSVLEVVRAFEAARGKAVPYRVQVRRAGDQPSYHANADSARAALGWQATRDQQTVCADTWRGQSNKPSGYVG